jgi:hypothetical protein
MPEYVEDGWRILALNMVKIAVKDKAFVWLRGEGYFWIRYIAGLKVGRGWWQEWINAGCPEVEGGISYDFDR